MSLVTTGRKLMAYWRKEVNAEPDFDRSDAVNLLLAVKAWVEEEAGLDWREVVSITFDDVDNQNQS